MTQDPTSLPPPPPPVEGPSKGAGCAFGGLAVVGSVVGGGILGGILVSILSDQSGLLAAVIGLLPLGLLIAAGVRWRKVPGFLLGIGLTLAISVALFTACFAAISQATS